jgi:hypothetical protein
MRKAINILGTVLRILGMLLTIPSFLLALPGMFLIFISEAIEEESIGNEKLASGIEEEHNNRQI